MLLCPLDGDSMPFIISWKEHPWECLSHLAWVQLPLSQVRQDWVNHPPLHLPTDEWLLGTLIYIFYWHSQLELSLFKPILCSFWPLPLRGQQKEIMPRHSTWLPHPVKDKLYKQLATYFHLCYPAILLFPPLAGCGCLGVKIWILDPPQQVYILWLEQLVLLIYITKLLYSLCHRCWSPFSIPKSRSLGESSFEMDFWA